MRRPAQYRLPYVTHFGKWRDTLIYRPRSIPVLLIPQFFERTIVKECRRKIGLGVKVYDE